MKDKAQKLQRQPSGPEAARLVKAVNQHAAKFAAAACTKQTKEAPK